MSTINEASMLILISVHCPLEGVRIESTLAAVDLYRALPSICRASASHVSSKVWHNGQGKPILFISVDFLSSLIVFTLGTDWK